MEMTEKRTIHRGDVYYVLKSPTYGSEQHSGRPAIIISNDICNENSDVVEVVYLTTRSKPSLPTHVEINCGGRKSLALCEQISSVTVERLSDFKCHATEKEMQLVDQALAISIGISAGLKLDGTVLEHWCPEDERMLAMVCLKYLQQVIGKDQLPEDCNRDVRSDRSEAANG